MAAPTWARAKARARAGPHPACVRANVHVGAALSIESAPFFLGIPRKRRFLKSAEHIHLQYNIMVSLANWWLLEAYFATHAHSAQA